MAEVCIEIRMSIPPKKEVPAENLLLVRLWEEPLKAAELIQLTVEERIREMAALHILAPTLADQRADLPSLANDQRNGTVERANVLFPSRHMHTPVLQMEIEKALRAFEAGHFLLLVNKHRIQSLNEEIILTADTQVQFLRLTPLVGG
jgi:hypothetical protein